MFSIWAQKIASVHNFSNRLANFLGRGSCLLYSLRFRNLNIPVSAILLLWVKNQLNLHGFKSEALANQHDILLWIKNRSWSIGSSEIHRKRRSLGDTITLFFRRIPHGDKINFSVFCYKYFLVLWEIKFERQTWKRFWIFINRNALYPTCSLILFTRILTSRAGHFFLWVFFFGGRERTRGRGGRGGDTSVLHRMTVG